MRRFSWLIVVALLLASVPAASGQASAPEPVRIVRGGEEGVPSGLDSILHEQVAQGDEATASQCFLDPGYGCTFTADDFVTSGTWKIEKIFIDGYDWGISPVYANALNWRLYTDSGGYPGSQAWSLSRGPTAAGVTISGADVTLDLVQAQGSVLSVPTGHWWLVFYVDMSILQYGQWFWNSGGADPWLPARLGMDGTWYAWLGMGKAFRLEGTITVEPDIAVSPTSLSAQQCPETSTSQTLQICNNGSAQLTWSLSESLAWLSAAPTSGALDAGACASVTATFSSVGVAPGSYSGSLTVSSNDPDTPSILGAGRAHGARAAECRRLYLESGSAGGGRAGNFQCDSAGQHAADLLVGLWRRRDR